MRADFKTLYEVIAINSRLIRQAEQIAERHALRACDAVQLAAAQQVNKAYIMQGLPPVTFISADQKLNAAAMTDGLAVDDPNLH